LEQYGATGSSQVRQEQQITVAYQTMISRYQDFTSGYFDVCG